MDNGRGVNHLVKDDEVSRSRRPQMVALFMPQNCPPGMDRSSRGFAPPPSADRAM
jgi:hypothetical protein